MEVSLKVENRKQDASKVAKRKELPEKYRAVDEDIYFEDPEKSLYFVKK